MATINRQGPTARKAAVAAPPPPLPKIDEMKKKKKEKGVTKGGQETYVKATAKKENKNPKSSKSLPKKDSKSTAPEPRKSRLTAYEEYAQKDSARPKIARSPPPQHIHRRPSQPDHDTPKGGVMDAEEFGRLKEYQSKERSRW